MFIPVMYNIKNKNILIAGGSNYAYQYITIFSKFTARITVVASEFVGNIQQLNNITLVKRNYIMSDLNNKDIVVICTDDVNLNKQIEKDAKEKGVMIFIAHKSENEEAYIPAFIKEEFYTVSVDVTDSYPLLKDKVAARIADLNLNERIQYFKSIKLKIRQLEESRHIQNDILDHASDLLFNDNYKEEIESFLRQYNK